MSQLIRWHGPCPGRPESDPEDARRIEQLGLQLRTTISEMQAIRQNHAQWIDRITRTLHEEADNRDYCSEFDDVMESMGLARRTKPYQVTISVTVELVWDGQARDSDHAEELASEWADVRDGQRFDLGGHRGQVTEIEMLAEEQ